MCSTPRCSTRSTRRYVVTPTERGRLRKFLERLGTAWYGYGWRSYDYAGHRIVGHRGGISGYRSLILFDPAKKSGVVALWNSNTSQPGGLEFEVMDMIYHLPFRDWLELNTRTGRAARRKSRRPSPSRRAGAAIPPSVQAPLDFGLCLRSGDLALLIEVDL